MSTTGSKLKQRPTLAPSQRRIRHIISILARNLRFNPSHFRTLSQSLSHPHSNSTSTDEDHRRAGRSSGEVQKKPIGTFVSHKRSLSTNYASRSGSTPNLVKASEVGEWVLQQQQQHSAGRRPASALSWNSDSNRSSGTLFTFAGGGPENERESAGPEHLLDSYFTLHHTEDGPPFYISETVMKSTNPTFRSLDDSHFTDGANKRMGSIIIRIWAARRNDDFKLLVEWDVDLCCLRYIGKDLKEVPNHLPDNTIIIGFADGYYTAPDEDDLPPHPHPELSNVEDKNGLVQEGQKAKRSYTYDTVMRLNNLHECIIDTRKSRDEVMQNVEIALQKRTSSMMLEREKGEWEDRVILLKQRLASETKLLEQDRRRIDALREELQMRRRELQESKERWGTQQMYLAENQHNLARNQDSLGKMSVDIGWKRAEIVAELFAIYPIEQSLEDSLLYQIGGVPLPNSVYVGYDEEMISVALGNSCHLINMLAHYFDIPLRYPMTPMASHATIRDPISMLVGPRDFPLYGRGQDRYHFEYGVFLLNKNIEQLMQCHGLHCMDLRHTLPNLNNLIQALLTTSPTQTSHYRKLIPRPNVFPSKADTRHNHDTGSRPLLQSLHEPKSEIVIQKAIRKLDGNVHLHHHAEPTRAGSQSVHVT